MVDEKAQPKGIVSERKWDGTMADASEGEKGLRRAAMLAALSGSRKGIEKVELLGA